MRALEDVSFAVADGSVHALLGENGAGKSTLLKALAGAHEPTSGEVVVGGGAGRVFRSTAEAIRAGVAVIYQELHLVPELSVAENLFLGGLPQVGGVLKKGELMSRARALLARVGEEIDPRARLGSLPIGQRQMIEIAKALGRGAKVIAFDEPTSSLSAREVAALFKVIRELKGAGCAILYVTHRMEEVYALCDAATVLRDGRLVATHATMEGVTPELIVKEMVGRDIADVYRYEARPLGEEALRVEGVAGEGVAVPASFTVRRGEIVGMFGLVGAGRSELLKLIFGASKRTGGRLRAWGEEVAATSPRRAIRGGIALAPEDRKKEGIFPVRSVLENLSITVRRRMALGGALVNDRWERANARGFVGRLAVRTPGVGQLIGRLSGGNQQKVILARWLSADVKVMLLDEPTRGIDVGARSEIYAIIYELARKGVGVVVASSDLPEVMGISDRVLVMREGEIVAEFARGSGSAEDVLRAAIPGGSGGGELRRTA